MVLLTGLVLAGVVCDTRSIRQQREQQELERKIDEVVTKWPFYGPYDPRESEVPPDLEVMIRDDFEFIDASNVHPTDDLRQRLSRLRRVKWLALSAETTAADLTWIGKITQLRGLSLAGADLTGADFLHLQNLQSLQLLNLPGAQIPGHDFQTLPRLAQLQFIKLHGRQVGDEHILHLVDLQLPALTDMSLNHTSVSDIGLIPLCKTYNLKTLRLYGSGSVTAESVDAIGRMTRLRHLEVTFTGLSPRGGVTPEVRRLLRMLPRCKIICHD